MKKCEIGLGFWKIKLNELGVYDLYWDDRLIRDNLNEVDIMDLQYITECINGEELKDENKTNKSR